MINNLPGPDKGLLDVLFGAKAPEQSQAVLPGTQELAGDQVGQVSVKDFGQLLVEAQDQPAAKVINHDSRSKEGSKQVSDEVAKCVAQAAQACMESAPKWAKSSQVGTTVKADTTVRDGTTVDKAQTQNRVRSPKSEDEELSVQQLAASVMAVQPKPAPKEEPKAVVAQPAHGVHPTTIRPQPMQVKQAPKQVSAQASQPQPRIATSAADAEVVRLMDSTPKPQPIDAQPRLVPILNSGVPRHGDLEKPSVLGRQVVQASQVPVQAPVQTMVQPVIIQMPIAIPMEVLSVDEHDDARAFGEASVTKVAQPSVLGATQDYLSGLEAVKPLSLSSLSMPVRGMERVKAHEQERESERERENDTKHATPDLGLVLPHVSATTIRDASIATASGNAAVSSAIPLQGGSVEVADPMAVAAQVSGLATKGGGTVRVRIMPENLGELTISVTGGRGRKLDVRFEATSGEAKDTLMQAMPELKAALKSARFDVGSIEVRDAVSAVAQWFAQSGDGNSAVQMSSRSSDFGGSGEFGQGQRQWAGQDQSSTWSWNNNGNSSRGWDRYYDQQEQGNAYANRREQQAYRQYRAYQEAAV